MSSHIVSSAIDRTYAQIDTTNKTNGTRILLTYPCNSHTVNSRAQCATPSNYAASQFEAVTTTLVQKVTTIQSITYSTLITSVTVTLPPNVPSTASSPGTTEAPHRGTITLQTSRSRSSSTRSSRSREKSNGKKKSSASISAHNTSFTFGSSSSTLDSNSSLSSHYTESSHEPKTGYSLPPTHSPTSATASRTLHSSASSNTVSAGRAKIPHSKSDSSYRTLATPLSSKSPTHLHGVKTNSSPNHATVSPSQQSDHQADAPSPHISSAKICAGVFSAIGGIALVVGLAYLIMRFRRKRKDRDDERAEKHHTMPEISRPILPPTLRAPSQRIPPRAPPPIPPRAFFRPTPPQTPPRGPLRVVNNISRSNSNSTDWSYSIDSRGQRRWSNPFDME